MRAPIIKFHVGKVGGCGGVGWGGERRGEERRKGWGWVDWGR